MFLITNQKKWFKIIITLSAPDNISHFDFIKEFGDYFMNQDFKQKVLNIKSLHEFIELISNYEVK
ncbi:PTS sugar transporter subunit IIA [Mycoplasmopsis cynos]|uniref:PTS sugar transporter subunit IIA n=1 Tax=Mycoplasmopsis cynos TaxID=171284 RepID=UPI0021FC6BFF|nr:PTS sugar transporter subunit IIA [Mycoplasmopsis cynos]UWV92990.1 PTS sugar transporter subunit IIA [Mycoplasmopsis cynos]